MTQHSRSAARRHFSMATCALLCALSAYVDAQAYPARPVRIIVAFPAGGGNDIIARFFATRLTAKLGQQMVIDNRGGASGRTRAVNRVPLAGCERP